MFSSTSLNPSFSSLPAPCDLPLWRWQHLHLMPPAGWDVPRVRSPVTATVSRRYMHPRKIVYTYIYIYTLCVCTHSHLIFPNTQPNVDESLRLGHNASKWPWSRNPKGGRDRRRFAVCHGLPPSNRVPPANVKTAILGDVKNISWKNPWALLRLVVLLMVQKSYIQSPDLGCIKRCK